MNISLHRPALALAVSGAALALGMLNPLGASAQVPSAKYRVSAIGFDVKAGTWDDALQIDGKCDEVFLAADVNVMKNSTGAGFASHSESVTYGDRNGYAGRTLAGSCTGLFQPTGGLQRDDVVTMNHTLWEGDLVKGDDAVTVSPALFEWDSSASALQSWIDWGATTLRSQRSVLDSLLGPDAKPILDWTQFGLDVAVSLKDVTGTSGTRPIGMKKVDASTFTYKPQTLALTYDTAALIASTSGPYGAGTVGMLFEDDTSLAGRYMLKLKVTRIDPAPAPAPTPTPTPAPVIDEPADGGDSLLCRRKPWMCA